MTEELEAIVQVLGFLLVAGGAGFSGFSACMIYAGYVESRRLAKEMMPHYEAGRLPEKPTVWNINRLLFSDPDTYRNIILYELSLEK